MQPRLVAIEGSGRHGSIENIRTFAVPLTAVRYKTHKPTLTVVSPRCLPQHRDCRNRKPRFDRHLPASTVRLYFNVIFADTTHRTIPGYLDYTERKKLPRSNTSDNN